MQPIIEVTKLIKEYGQKGSVYRALKGIDLKVEKGEFIGIMGPSGSGKTTLLNILSTIDNATSGQVKIEGKDVTAIKTKDIAEFRRSLIGFVFQDFNLLDNMTIRDNIALPLTLNNAKASIILEKTEELTKKLGIYEQLDKYPYQLSGGQKQRAAICRALVGNPKVVFADEPTGALDSRAATELLECFKKVKAEFGTTLVMVTHDAAVASYCDRVLFLKDGTISGQMESGGDTSTFYQKILNMLAMMGGKGHERH
ncbi:MAG: ABC transporter ATP-binding protein [Niameybacter sp.]|uniref:ABC transporter ATP-binding protein n=1 Tax=Niameybacter sp. TaxID=2033640 RepID=UPI002FC64C04